MIPNNHWRMTPNNHLHVVGAVVADVVGVGEVVVAEVVVVGRVVVAVAAVVVAEAG